jgi:hypothetical protein
MAFLKYAHAKVVESAITMAGWDEVRAKALALKPAFADRQAKVVLQKYQPKKYLLSHCTIIASVDSESVGLPLGRQMVDGFQIDRRYDDFFISPGTAKYVNNNHDCWERKLLLASFRTFVGAENYVEHLQIPEMSKGKIVDAAARDIGDSIYVDILVATDREHDSLVKAVKTGQLQTLSMGCQVGFTICSKCGNVAEDEAQLCSHIRYMKGNSFIDGLGRQRKIAELCGHITAEPGSVRFIEASWVANPAFTGAVLRNILTPEEAELYGDRVQVAFNQPPRTADAGAMQRAARAFGSHALRKGQFDFGDEGGGEEEGAAPAEEESPADKAIDEYAKFIRERALEKVRGEMSKGEAPRADLNEDRNDTLVKEAVQNHFWRRIARHVCVRAGGNNPRAHRLVLGLLLYKQGGWQGVKTSSAKFTGREFLALSRLLDAFEGVGIAGESRVYRTVVAVGGLSGHGDENGYLAACRQAFGRNLTGSEMDALVEKGRIYDLGKS